jgi:hypothetical protein
MSSIGRRTPGTTLSKSPLCFGSGEERTSRYTVVVLLRVKGLILPDCYMYTPTDSHRQRWWNEFESGTGS